MVKKLISLLIVILILVNLCALANASTMSVINADNISTKAGERFDVRLNLSGNTGLAALSVAMEYDDTVLTLIESENGEVFSDNAFSTNSNQKENPYKLNWVNVDLSASRDDGELAVLSFTVADDSIMSNSVIKLSVLQAFDSDMNDVSISTQNINVKISGSNKKIKGISLTPPDKTKYKLNESLDLSGLAVKALYSDNTFGDITEKAEIKGFDSSKSGKKLIVVCYKGFSSAFSIDIGSGENILYLSSKEVKAVAGEIVEIPFEIGNNPGITGLEAQLCFDNEIFKIQNLTNGNVFDSSYMTTGGNKNASPYKVLWNNSKARENYNSNGLLGVVGIELSKTAKVGSYPIKFDLCKAVDSNLDSVEVSDNEAIINVYGKKYLFADADGDGKITVKDASIIQKYIAGADTDLDVDAVDCDGDKKISVLDATRIQKFITELDEDESFGTYFYI